MKTCGFERHAAQRPPRTARLWLRSCLILTLGPRAISQGRGVEKPKGTEQLEIVARGRSSRRLQDRMVSIFAAEASQGRLRSAYRVFYSGFPNYIEEFIPSHLFTAIPTASGAASAAAAQPRIEPAPGGGGGVRDLKGPGPVLEPR